MSQFKYAYNALVYYGEDIAKSIDRVARFGYDAIEVVGEPAQFDGKAIRKRAHDAGMTVAAGGRIGGVAVFVGPDVRLLAVESHRLRWFFPMEWRGLAVAVVCVGLMGCEPANLAIDPAYGGDGFADISEESSFIPAHAFEVAKDGSIVTVLNDRLTRVRPNGTVDPGFGVNTPSSSTS